MSDLSEVAIIRPDVARAIKHLVVADALGAGLSDLNPDECSIISAWLELFNENIRVERERIRPDAIERDGRDSLPLTALPPVSLSPNVELPMS